MISESQRKRRRTVIFALICLLIAYLALNSSIDTIIYANFMKGESLKYSKTWCVTHAEILGSRSDLGKGGSIKIHDKEVIEKIIEYVNSLELVEGLRPKDGRGLNKKGAFEIILYGESVLGVIDTMLFSSRFLRVTHDGIDHDYTDYFVKNSGYNIINKNTNISQYIFSLLEEYGYLE